jgi:putative phage-type endonuclease
MSDTIVVTDRAAWLAERQTGIGASDAAAILGVSPWKGALQLFYEKKGQEPPPQSESLARELGLLLEDPIATLYRKRTGRTVTRPQPGEFWLRRHPKKAYMLATLDGLQVYNGAQDFMPQQNVAGVLEIKTASFSKSAQWKQEAPVEYQIQVQHQLACSEMEFGSVAALVGGTSFIYTDLKRDPEFITLLEAAIDEFWQRLQLNDPPPADGTEATKDFLKRLYPNTNPTSVSLPAEAIEWDVTRLSSDAEIKRHERLKTEAENMLRNAIGENAQGVMPNGVVYTLKTQSRAEYVAKASTFRVLRRAGPKPDVLPTIPKGLAPPLDLSSLVKRAYFDGEDHTQDDGEF